MTRAARVRMRVLLVLLVLVAVAAAGWLVVGRRLEPAEREPGPADTAQAGLRATTLWFASDDGDSLVSEVRELPEQDDFHTRVAQLVDALGRGPGHGGVAMLPPGTSVLHAYLDDRGLLTLDLSRPFQQGFHGGSSAEDLVTGSLLRTIGSNLPQVKQVLIVCGGGPIASLGGHLPLDQPIDPHAIP